jgi:hypothetical protein
MVVLAVVVAVGLMLAGLGMFHLEAQAKEITAAMVLFQLGMVAVVVAEMVVLVQVL